MDIRAESEDLLANNDVTDVDRQKATASLLTKKIAVLTVWFKLNLAGKGDADLSSFTSKDATEMSSLLSRVYAEFGITGDNKSIFDENGRKRRMPILQNWYDALRKDEHLSKYAYVLQPYIDGVAANLNGQTNVDLSKLVTVYNVDGEIIPEELLPAYIYLAFQSSYERIKEDIYVRDVLILDEVWQMMKVKECAEQVRDAIKLMRSYNGSCLIATQELSDFFGKSGDFGGAVVNNSDFKIFMHMEEKELKIVRQYYRLDDEDEEAILGFEKGEALLIAGANKVKIKVKIKPTERELRAYNTDRNNRV
jgi:type IV secretory pathway VirB4 component